MKAKGRNIFVVLFITILFVITYLLSSSLFFTVFKEKEDDRYQQFVDTLTNYYSGFYDWIGPERLMRAYADVFDNLGYPVYPALAAVYDENGDIVTMMGSYINCPTDMDPDVRGEYDFDKQIFIDEYLTPEIKQQIFAFFNYQPYVEHIRVSEFDYIVREEKVIPISFTLFNTFHVEKELKIVLSDEEYPDVKKLVYEKEEYPYGLWPLFFDLNEYSEYHEKYEYLRELLLNQKNIAKKIYAHEADWHWIVEEDHSLIITNITLSGVDYVLATASVFDPIAQTFKSEEFRSIMTYQTVFFTVFYFVSVFLLVTHFIRSKRLENAKIAFTSAAAHELKTPLAVIENQCECIMENIAPEKNEGYVNSIYNESMRMNKLVATLLQYNRLASANKIKKEKCDLVEIVKTEIDKYKPLIFSKKIRFEVNIAVETAKIKCNPELIALVVDNYLSNAVKHTENDKRIAIHLRKSLNGYVFTVYNEGENIKQELRRKLWDIFYREDESRNSEDNSTGMGLAICKKILKHHRYCFGYRNKPDGVEFYFRAK